MRIPTPSPPIPLVFLDANIFLRHLRNDHPQWSPACRQVFADIEAGRLDGWTSELVVAEVVFLLESKKHYHQPRQAIAEALGAVLFLPHLKLERKGRYRRVLQLYATYPKLSYVDCHTASCVEANQTAPELYSYDTEFDAIETLTRREPATAGASEERVA